MILFFDVNYEPREYDPVKSRQRCKSERDLRRSKSARSRAGRAPLAKSTKELIVGSRTGSRSNLAGSRGANRARLPSKNGSVFLSGNKSGAATQDFALQKQLSELRTELSRLKHSIQLLEKKKQLEEQKVSTVIDICSELTPDDPEFDLAERIINEIFELESANQGLDRLPSISMQSTNSIGEMF
ncbi:Oidioi.mRNA.OKI2018_I69.PAR.g10486.t1.cds [Oikopleura dioica]|uniref:Oidioi.mRNA.OKI2018_I69.PAR.g10486.t1.cds n=1 Tax=Oikopleura dioica TaxID=34765 RepID=A0ABN7RQV6_OIKDI|nr:Oidioi.mRNA.OKI2018_I69.PAR.g10486.t1.cds [Oikopleura dioica]